MHPAARVKKRATKRSMNSKKPLLNTSHFKRGNGPNAVYQINISLMYLPYKACRTILVPGSLNLNAFIHLMIIAMGWSDYHMHMLQVDDTFYQGESSGVDGIFAALHGVPDDAFDANEYIVADVMSKGTIAYLAYDFGDRWEHQLIVEDIFESVPQNVDIPCCIDGEGACPPEDCGGIPGIEHLLELMNDPDRDREEYESILEWLGGHKFNKDLFSAEEVTRTILGMG